MVGGILLVLGCWKEKQPQSRSANSTPTSEQLALSLSALQVMEKLAQVSGPQHLGFLERVLHTPYPTGVHVFALQKLSRIRNSKATQLLITTVIRQKKNRVLVENALAALVQQSTKEGRAFLQQLLVSRDKDTALLILDHMKKIWMTYAMVTKTQLY